MAKEKIEGGNDTTSNTLLKKQAPDIAKILSGEIRLEFVPVDYNSPEGIARLKKVIAEQKAVMKRPVKHYRRIPE